MPMIKVVTDRPEHFQSFGWNEFAKVDDCLDYFEKKDHYQFDIETNGLSPIWHKMHCAQFGTEEVQFVVDTPTINLLNFKKLLQSERAVYIQNAAFERAWMMEAGIVIPMHTVRDTQTTEQKLTMGMFQHKANLKALAKKYLKLDISKAEQSTIIDAGLDRIEHVEYAGLDVRIVKSIHDKQLKAIKKQDLELAVKMENEFSMVIAYMEWCGIYLDQDRAYALHREIEYEETKALIKLKNYFKKKYLDIHTSYPNINWGSNEQVKRVFELIGINIVDKKGKRTVDIKMLKSQADKFKIIALYSRFKEKNKLVTTYGRKWNQYIHPETKRIHTKFRAIQETGRTSCGSVSQGPFPNCLSTDTQVLTNRGWKFNHELNIEEDKVAMFDKDKDELRWGEIQNYIEGNQPCVNFKKRALDITCTYDHNMLFWDRKSLQYKNIEAKNYYKDYSIPVSSNLDSGKTIDINVINLVVATQADAHINYKYKYLDFTFYKERKFSRLIRICDTLGLDYTIGKSKDPKRKRINIKLKSFDILQGLLGNNKQFTYDILDYDLTTRKCFIEELFQWDGSYTRRNNYASNKEQNVDVIQAVACSVGRRCRKRIYKKNSYQLDFANTKFCTFSNAQVTDVGIKPIWCIKVETGYFMCRTAHNTFITGNCQNLPKEERFRYQFAGQRANVLITADYSSQESVNLADISGEKKMIKFYKSGGADLHSFAVQQMYPKLKKLSLEEIAEKHSSKRQAAKVLNFAIAYGGSAHTLSEKLNISMAEAERIYTAYMKAFPGLAAYFEEQKYEGIRNGFILIPDKYKAKRYIYDWENLADKAENLEKLKYKNRDEYYKVRGQLGMIQRNSLNTPCQGMAANQTKQAGIYFMEEIIKRKWWGKVKIVNEVHDEYVVEANQRTASKVAPVLEECMVRAANETLKHLTMKVTVKIEKHWVK